MKARITCPYCGTKTEIEVEVGRREPTTIRESFQLIDGRVAE